MSFEEIEQHLKKMEALSNYERVVKENAMLAEELRLERKKHADEVKELRQQIESFQALRVKYGESEYELQEFDALVESRLKEWKEKEMEKQLEERWAKASPLLLHNRLKAELQAYPKGCLPQLKELIDSAADTRMNELLCDKHSWPGWFWNLYHSEVKEEALQMIDKEFQTRVELEVEKRVEQKTLIEWPSFLERVITPFCRSSLESQLTNIICSLNLICDKCGIVVEVTITPDDVAELIKRPKITCSCPNPNCRDWGLPHQITITLGQVIYAIVNTRTKQTY